MAAEAAAGNSGAFTNLLNSVTQAQQEGIQLQQGLNEAKRDFDAQSAGLEMENAISSKVASLVSGMAQTIQ
ncbi:MAG: hypothetical protein KDI44_09315 [Thiothrix sp.]|nr:hypothetical protein [Thiothrix sp.]HPQ93993.1 hypothetical protein [Thiolinea sp.]